MTKPRRTSGLIFWVVLIMVTPFQEPALPAQPCTREDHAAWIADVLKRMETIKPGMTRQELLEVFRQDGGGRLMPRYGEGIMHDRFVSRDCSYCKVDVELRLAVQPDRGEGKLHYQEDPRDIVLTISRPYLQRPIWD